jgi:hypothetical protein
MFDLLDRPLVYVTVKWPGVKAGDQGEAVPVENSVEIQVELLDDVEVQDWIHEGQRDPHAAERADLIERLNANAARLDAGEPGAGAEAVALAAEDAALRKRDQAANAARDLAAFKKVAKGWRGIKHNGRAADWSDANIAALLAVSGFGNAFGTAYLATWRGQVEIREKNSEGSPANGQAVEPTEKTNGAATS